MKSPSFPNSLLQVNPDHPAVLKHKWFRYLYPFVLLHAFFVIFGLLITVDFKSLVALLFMYYLYRYSCLVWEKNFKSSDGVIKYSSLVVIPTYLLLAFDNEHSLPRILGSTVSLIYLFYVTGAVFGKHTN